MNSGYIRHWLVAGPKETPYAGPPGPDEVLRKESLDYTQAIAPASAHLDGAGPFARTWRYHDPGRNEFVEFSTFCSQLTIVEYYGFTEVVVSTAGERKVRFWAAGAADLWLNDENLARLNVTRYRNPDSQPVVLPLKQGVNRLCVRLQCLGVRDTRILFGLSLDHPNGVAVRMAGAERIAQASRWIDQVRPSRGGEALESKEPAPLAAPVVRPQGTPLGWPVGSSVLRFADGRPASLVVEAEVFQRDAVASLYAITHFPSRIVFVGREIASVPSGLKMGAHFDRLPQNHPVRIAYEAYFKGACKDRHIADPATVFFAVRGADAYWDVHTRGRMDLQPDMQFQWINDPTGNQTYLLKRKVDGRPNDRLIETTIEDLILTPPQLPRH